MNKKIKKILSMEFGNKKSRPTSSYFFILLDKILIINILYYLNVKIMVGRGSF